MIPYTTFTYFAIAAIALLPAVLLGVAGKSFRVYAILLTIGFAWLTFMDSRRQLLFLAGYTLWQWLLVRGYLALRRHVRLGAGTNTSTNTVSGAVVGTSTVPGSIYAALVLLSIAPLAVTKLAAVHSTVQTFGFLGISYLTFKCVLLLVEMKDGQIKELPFWQFFNYVLFFPTLTSGPIDRYRRFVADFASPPSAPAYRELLVEGIHRIFRGFLYKFIIGYLIKTYWLTLPAVKADTFAGVWNYMYAYSFYLFFDFAGYSAFAIGISYLLGVRTPENFRYPFISRNIKDFWNRWHITLSYWFRDFVYMRLVMLLARNKWVVHRYALSSIGYAALFILMGFWHGLALHYIVYGVYHAALMIGFDGFERLNKRYRFWSTRAFMRPISILITFHAVCFGFLIFSGRLF